jgi:hypothetical protein
VGHLLALTTARLGQRILWRSVHGPCFRLLSTEHGIVIATEKKSSSILIDDPMIQKVDDICPNIGIVGPFPRINEQSTK